MGTNTLDPVLLSFKANELAPQSRNTAVGLIAAAGLLVAVFTQPIIGTLSDNTRTRLGRRVPYLIVGTLLAIVALFAVAFAPSLGLLLLGMLGYQLTANTAQAPWQALLPDQLPGSLRGAASGLKSFFEILGFILGRRVAGSLVADGALGAAVAAAAVVLLVSMILTTLTARFLRNSVEESSTPESSPAQVGGIYLMRRSRWPKGLGWWITNRTLFWGSVIALNTFVIFYLVDVVGMTFPEATRLFGDVSVALGLSLLIITVPAGRLTDKVGRRPMIFAACFMALAGNLMLLAARTRPSLIIAGGLLGLATGIFLSASWALATDLVPRVLAAGYLGIANIATAGGSFLGRLAGGALIDPINRLTGGQEAGYLTLYTLTLLGFLVAALAILRLPRDRDRGLQPSTQPRV